MPVQRRQFLSSLAASFSMTAAGLWTPRQAYADDLSLADRIDLVYRNRFEFDSNGEPMVTIGLLEGQDEVILSAESGLNVLPSGRGGTVVRGAKRWRIYRSRGKRADESYSLWVGEFPVNAIESISKEHAMWKLRGFTIQEHEVGAVFGVRGRVLDTRRIALTIGGFSQHDDAQKKAKLLSRKFKTLIRVHHHVSRRATGEIIAHDLETGIQVQVQSVLWFTSQNNAKITVESATGHGTSTTASKAYRGEIYVAVDRKGKLAVVNNLRETDILAGLVPAEMFASAPHAALKAQAIAARGQLLAKIGTRHRDDPYLLCANTHCQVYAGSSTEHHRATKAVRETKGHVLMRKQGSRLVDTVYSANSGGHTEHNECVWPGEPDPQLRGRPDPLLKKRFHEGIHKGNIRSWLMTSPSSYSRPKQNAYQQAYRWETAIDPDVVLQHPKIQGKLRGLSEIQVLRRGLSGRAIEVALSDKRRRVVLDGELTIRRVLGNLRSSMFIVTNTNSKGQLVLTGGGHGHGVGMCQHGAMGMGRSGKPTSAILSHYYPGSVLSTLW